MKHKILLTVSALILSLTLMTLSEILGQLPRSEAQATLAPPAVTLPPPPILVTPTPGFWLYLPLAFKNVGPAPTPTPKSTTEPSDEAEMVLVSSGPFPMGQDGSKPRNEPAHIANVFVFEIDKFEVTNDRFARFVNETGYVTYAEKNSYRNWRDKAEGRGTHPVVYVTWDDAVAFCQWAGKRLPTEAEWEKAARGIDARLYPWGNEYGDPPPANVYEQGVRDTVPVGNHPGGVSPYGVEDMAGNVREWTADFFLPYPGQNPDADPFFGDKNRVHRGGGWFDGEDGELVTTYNRNAGPPKTSANDDIGFRCARDL